jgi:hypothetical protein
MTISIAGLEKAAVLRALFNASHQQGMGFMDPRGARQIGDAEARSIIDARIAARAGLYFDYLYGRVLKVRIDGDEIETRLYDRDNGEGAAERAIATLKSAGGGR